MFLAESFGELVVDGDDAELVGDEVAPVCPPGSEKLAQSGFFVRVCGIWR
jgi:hypothetical protein